MVFGGVSGGVFGRYLEGCLGGYLKNVRRNASGGCLGRCLEGLFGGGVWELFVGCLGMFGKCVEGCLGCCLEES